MVVSNSGKTEGGSLGITLNNQFVLSVKLH